VKWEGVAIFSIQAYSGSSLSSQSTIWPSDANVYFRIYISTEDNLLMGHCYSIGEEGKSHPYERQKPLNAIHALKDGFRRT